MTLGRVNLTVKTLQHTWSTQKPRLHSCTIMWEQKTFPEPHKDGMHCCRSECELPFAAAEPTTWPREQIRGLPLHTSEGSGDLGPPWVCALCPGGLPCFTGSLATNFRNLLSITVWKLCILKYSCLFWVSCRGSAWPSCASTSHTLRDCRQKLGNSAVFS